MASNGKDMTSISLTEFIRKSFGQDFIDTLKTYDLTTRDLFELSTPTTQCVNMIGECADPAACMCWLCGLPIYMNEEGASVTKKEDIADIFYPECEHVLPVMQAVLILGGLYVDKHKDDPFWSHIQEHTLRFEYKWAHHLCNHAKSDIVFIDNRGELNKYVVDSYLAKIYAGLKEYLRVPKSSFLHDRYAEIENVVKPIKRYIQDRDENMFLLSAVTTAKSHVDDLQDILSEKSKMHTFFQQWKPEVVVDYPRPFLAKLPATMIQKVTLDMETIIRSLPIPHIQEYIRDTLLTMKHPRRFISFYNALLGTQYVRIQQIKDIDIRNAIFTNFLNPLDYEKMIYLIQKTSMGNRSPDKYIIEICLLILHVRILNACNAIVGMEKDTSFVALIQEKIGVLKGLEVYTLDRTTFLLQTFLTIHAEILHDLPPLTDERRDSYDQILIEYDTNLVSSLMRGKKRNGNGNSQTRKRSLHGNSNANRNSNGNSNSNGKKGRYVGGARRTRRR